MKMKKRILKDWVALSLFIIQLINIIMLSAECNNIKIFIISKILFIINFILIHNILIKYSRIGDMCE